MDTDCVVMTCAENVKLTLFPYSRLTSCSSDIENPTHITVLQIRRGSLRSDHYNYASIQSSDSHKEMTSVISI